ncbi:MAG: hypothetical protein JWP12_2791 [Bacteroidetes bacterium]|nr:hypothetical protein [Bacteroidota bacterium]
MKKITILFFAIIAFKAVSAQMMIATMEVKEPIPGTCSEKTVYALFGGFKGQTQAVPPITEKEMMKKLQEELAFLKENPHYKGTLMMSCIINCKGEMVRCEVDNKSGNDQLDQQVLAIFNTFKTWGAGTLNGNAVDCVELFSIDIKKGKVKME